MNQNVPTHVTHRPIHVVVPTDDDTMVERGPQPTPSLWQAGVQVTHKASRQTGVVRVVDWKTNQFRLVGAARSEWQACGEWDVLVELTPQERKKEAAREMLLAEIATLDADVLPLVQVLCDDEDPEKALAKLTAMRRCGMLGARPVEAAPLAKTTPKRIRPSRAKGPSVAKVAVEEPEG